jgi:UDP-3-O-[3-hydroxymyristoyl] glucosamine N-acyltransferase
MAISLGELATQFGCELIGDPSTIVTRVATLSAADASSISFFSNPNYRQQLGMTGAAAVILRAADAALCPTAALVAANPYLLYAFVAAALHPVPALPAGIHPSAIVAASAVIAKDAHIGPHAVIGDDCIVGDAAVVGAGCIVGDGCVIGAASRLVANVTLVGDVTIGARCILHPGSIIGCDGFGNALGDSGWVKVPQLGGVRIGDDVEVGANSTIDRGAIENTVIENGVRLDNLVQIAHNVRIGEHTAIAAMSGISGSTVIGKRCMFGGQSGTVGHITICDDVTITGKTMVTKSIDQAGTYSGGFPAEAASVWRRRIARFRRLGESPTRKAPAAKGKLK